MVQDLSGDQLLQQFALNFKPGGEGSSEVCFEVFLKAGKGRGRPEFAFALNPRLQIDLPGRVGVMLLFRVPSWRPKQPAQLAGLLVAAWLA